MRICVHRKINLHLCPHATVYEDFTDIPIPSVFYVDTEKGELGKHRLDKDGNVMVNRAKDGVEEEFIQGMFRVELDEEGQRRLEQYGDQDQ